MALQLQAELEGPFTGPLNPAFVDFSFADLGVSGLTLSELTARVALYLARAVVVMSEQDVKLQAIRYRTLPSDPFNLATFPVSDYAAAKADATFDTSIVAITAYGANLSPATSNVSSGRGDSVCVTTKAGSGGRKGIGRHFIPYLCRQAVGADGLMGAGQVTAVQVAYDEAYLGGGAGVLAAPAIPGVYSRLDSTLRVIVNRQVSRVPSRLRSRTK
jgi:hypothetical protein